MNTIEIPTLLFWENGNSWYGSLGNTRFYIKPETPEGAEEKQLTVKLWKGPLAMDRSEILAEAAFPVSGEGLARTAAWLEAQAEALNRGVFPI